MFQLQAPVLMDELKDPLLDGFGVQVAIQREDLAFASASGNKWRKLKYNLLQAKEEGCQTLLTFGGAYSNHIAATAAAGKQFGFKTIGLIRGEADAVLNPTLKKAAREGMELHYLTRNTYREKNDPSFLTELYERFGKFYLLPEGGSNLLAVKGCAEIIEPSAVHYDFVCCAVATGATLAGLVAGPGGHKKVLGFSSLKGADFLNKDVAAFLTSYSSEKKLANYRDWEIIQDYHFGGYAKTNQELSDFIREFNNRNKVPLDCIYTGKMFYGLYDMIKKGYFQTGVKLLAIHTGGLQGNAGFDKFISDAWENSNI